jgi:chromosome segregation ATPase
LPPSKESYQKYAVNLQTVIAKVAFWKANYQQALIEKERATQSLKEAEKRYDDLLTSATEHSDDSIASLEQALLTIRSLRLLLRASDDSVKTAQERLASAEVEHSAALTKAEASAKRLEDANFWLTVGLIAVGVLAIGEGVGLIFR